MRISRVNRQAIAYHKAKSAVLSYGMGTCAGNTDGVDTISYPRIL